MSTAELANWTLNYESHGDENAPALVLVTGWKGQLTFWPKSFINGLVKSGYRVIVLDNRDAGQSEKASYRYLPPAISLWTLRFSPMARYLLPYTVEDMADDVAGLVRELDLGKVHIAGFSLGGLISQVFAARYPEHVLSLTVMGSTTNNMALPAPPLDVIKHVFLTPDWHKTRKQRVDLTIKRWKSFGTPDGHQDSPEYRAEIEAAYGRGVGRIAARRQFAAGVATGDIRRKYSRKITAPTLVLHGSEDRMLTPAHGADVASNIAGSRLEIIEGWGHDFAPRYVPAIKRHLVRHLDSVSA